MDIILNGTKYACPVAHEDPLFTIEIWQRIVTEWDISLPEEKRDYFHLFCIMTGSDFKQFHATAENEVTIYNAIRWFVESYYQWGEMPKVLKIGDKVIDLPRKVQALSIGQNIALKNTANASKSWVTDKGKAIEYGCYAKATAIYLQPLYSGEMFNYDKVEELEQIILKMPAYLIRPIGFFTLASALPSLKSTQRNWLQTLTNRTQSFLTKSLTWPKRTGFQGTMMLILLGTILKNILMQTLIL